MGSERSESGESRSERLGCESGECESGRERERVWSWRVRSLGVVSLLVGSVKVGIERSESGESRSERLGVGSVRVGSVLLRIERKI